MPFYTIIAGVNGVGKSSLTGVLKTQRRDLGYVIDVDSIAAKNKCSAIDAGKTALRKIDHFLTAEISFSQETTLSGRQVEKTAKIAKEKGYTVRLLYIALNTSEECIERIKNRVEKGGHSIDSEDVLRRHNKRFEDLIRILPYCDEARFFDNENGFIEVGEHYNGEIVARGDYRPAWLAKLIEQFEKAYQALQ